MRHVREAVRFHDGVRPLEELGVTSYVELGPDGVLTAMADDCLTAQGALLVSLLRRDTEEDEALTTALARLHVRGNGPDWAGVARPAGARRTELPTYAFQRQRYWLEATEDPGDITSAGLHAAGHPLLSAAVPLAGADGTLFTGLLSTDRHPWLADHALDGKVLFPGTAFLELALQACDRVGAGQVAELALEAPLVLPMGSGVQLQLAVSGADEFGGRTLTVHSRPATESGEDLVWVRHASGSLIADRPEAAAGLSDPAAWPPAGAEPVDVSGLYERIADSHFAYGPAFRGLRAAWRHGDEVFAEIAIDAQHHGQAARFTVHPALLDAALHTVALAGTNSGKALVPFSFTGVSVTATGPTALRVRLTPQGQDTYAVRVADGSGASVADISGLVLRPVDTAKLAAAEAGPGTLYRLAWAPLPGAEPDGSPLAVVGDADADDALSRWAADQTGSVSRFTGLAALGAAVDAGRPMPGTVLVPLPGIPAGDAAEAAALATHQALGIAQSWLRDERFADARLVFCTRHAMTTETDDAIVTDPAQAAVWGLIRTAKAENPGRFALLDHDGTAESLAALTAALTTGEPELALRGGSATAPRLARAQDIAAQSPAGSDGFDGFDEQGTVLVTGAAGVLGRQVARHLVTERGARSVLLASRRGADAEGMRELSEELRAEGAAVEVAACDISDRDAVERLLAGIPDKHPLTAVIHTAGVLDDGVFDALTPDRLDTVLRVKVDGALHLDELTSDLDLSAFVLFSSLAGTFGGVGQGNYAAANAFLDAFAAQRRAAGRRAVSLAWGLWAERSGMTGKLDETDLRRLERGGVRPMDTGEALALLDVALAAQEPFLVPAKLDTAALRASDGSVPHLLRGLVSARAPRVGSADRLAQPVANATAGQGLGERLSALPEQDRLPAVMETVLGQAALILGYDSADAVDPDRGFLELGFDSLTAVELRNRLGTVTGVRLPATLLFDYPTPTELAAHLLVKVAPAAPRPCGRDAMLSQLDQWDAEFARIVADTVLHDDLRDRLQRMLSSLDGVPAGADIADDSGLEEVPDDELLDFIENELGGA